MHIPDLLQRSARLAGEVEAVWDGERRRTYGELNERVGRLAAGLAKLGIDPGDRVALLASNRVEFVELYFAAASLGCVLVPINWRLRAGEIAFQIDDAEARAVIVEAQFEPLVETLVEGCRQAGSERLWIGLGESSSDWAVEHAFESLIGQSTLPRRAPAPDEVAVQMYTSGTTGTPKGAMLTHRNVVSMVLAWLYEIRLRQAPDRFLLVMPLFHVGGLLHTMSTIAAGARLLLVTEFRPGPILDTLVDREVTHVLFVPAMVQWLLQEQDITDHAFPHLRRIIYGGAPMPVPVLERALQVFGCEFVQGYGLTETTGVVTVLRPEDHDPRNEARLASAGRAVLTCALRIVDDGGNEVPAGDPRVGEVLARGEQVAVGYWKRDEATNASFQDGWFRTGDLATIDEEGYVTIVDRLKDMILVASENVYPSEVEAALVLHPAVCECTVIGIPHETWGEEVLAIVVLEDGATARSTELIRHCRASLARFKCPTRVEFKDALPRNAGGKVLKRELREPYWAGHERRV
jgi:acyl-CoA synthetase (AMP-forming)/AMP-acid ligase II